MLRNVFNQIAFCISNEKKDILQWKIIQTRQRRACDDDFGRGANDSINAEFAFTHYVDKIAMTHLFARMNTSHGQIK